MDINRMWIQPDFVGDSDSDSDSDDDDDDDDNNGELLEAIGRRETLEVVRSIVVRRPHLIRKIDRGRRRLLPYHAAVESGSSLAVLEYLRGCYPPAACGRSGRYDSFPLHCVGFRTPIECVAFLLAKDPRAITLRNRAGDLPLHAAIANGASPEAIRRLVEGLPGSISERDAGGRLAIHVAATTAQGPNRLDVIRYLIEVAPLSVRERTTYDGQASVGQGKLPLHLALEGENADPAVVRCLLEQWPESAREWSLLDLPLHLALQSRAPSEEAVRIVLDAYPEALQEIDGRGFTVLGRAVRDRSLAPGLLVPLIEGWPDALLTGDSFGNLPIHGALKVDPPVLETVGLLADRCPDSLYIANDQGHCPIHIAIAQDSVEALKLLAERAPDMLRVVDTEGNTLAHFAASTTDVSADVARYVIEAWPEALVATNANGDTPALVAIDRACPSDAVEVFVGMGPESLRVANASGRRPLLVAIPWNHVDVVRRIVETDPESIRYVDSRGRTAVHWAASPGEGARGAADAGPQWQSAAVPGGQQRENESERFVPRPQSVAGRSPYGSQQGLLDWQRRKKRKVRTLLVHGMTDIATNLTLKPTKFIWLHSPISSYSTSIVAVDIRCRSLQYCYFGITILGRLSMIVFQLHWDIWMSWVWYCSTW
jgi:ankyrin repeat protein